jgi:uncharacterized oxidoreductase
VRRAEGVGEILVPGDPEERSRAERRANGIDVPDTIWAQLRECAEKLGTTLPDAVGR